MHQDPNPHAGSIQKLQECLQGELSAVESYERALKSVTHVALHRSLQEILVSHARRSEMLRAWIERLGGEPANDSGAWGVFANLVQVGADLLGEPVAIAALDEGESRGVHLYAEGLNGCDATTKEMIRTELLPEQRRTRAMCRVAKDFVNGPS
jgi:hypothetical protein